jgi:hypothetical protein
MRPVNAGSLEYYPREVGVNALTVTGTPQNGSWFGIGGCNQLVLEIEYVRVAGTNLSFQLETTRDNGTTVNVVQLGSGAASAMVFDDLVFTDDNGASHKTVLYFPIVGAEGRNMRLGAITCTSGAATAPFDTLTVTAIVATVP